MIWFRKHCGFFSGHTKTDCMAHALDFGLGFIEINLMHICVSKDLDALNFKIGTKLNQITKV